MILDTFDAMVREEGWQKGVVARGKGNHTEKTATDSKKRKDCGTSNFVFAKFAEPPLSTQKLRISQIDTHSREKLRSSQKHIYTRDLRILQTYSWTTRICESRKKAVSPQKFANLAETRAIWRKLRISRKSSPSALYLRISHKCPPYCLLNSTNLAEPPPSTQKLRISQILIQAATLANLADLLRDNKNLRSSQRKDASTRNLRSSQADGIYPYTRSREFQNEKTT